MSSSYGFKEQKKTFPLELEEFELLGFTIIEKIISEQEIDQLKKRSDSLHDLQTKKLSNNALRTIREEDLLRCPLIYDELFLTLAFNPKIIGFVEQILGANFCLHLQNVILNRPSKTHHQAAWHRDMPYQHYVTSKPFAISALVCLDPFNAKTGGTFLLPGSHRNDENPSQPFLEKHKIQIVAESGDVIMFNSFLMHKAGNNTSKETRRGINHVYTVPIIKQQIDLTEVEFKYDIKRFKFYKHLGFNFKTPKSVDQYRKMRLKKLGGTMKSDETYDS